MEPLHADPKRQASDIFRGFFYQIWQSLCLWINLEDDESLYLEGAEDIDRISPTEATTTQVKDITSKNLTLNSSEIVDAISNYWKLKQKESRKIKFQFLTTAQRGKEKKNGSIFNGVSGLDYWDICKDTQDVAPLRKFLLTISGFPQDLKDFIKNSTDEDLRDSLIRPIYWLTNEGNLEATRKKVENSLVIHGQKNDCPPNESKNAAIYLADLLWTKICEKSQDKRVLNKADFLLAFQASQTELISKNQLRMMRDHLAKQDKMMETLSDQISSAFSGPSNNSEISISVSKPYVVDKSIFVTRKVLVDDIQLRMQTLSFILIRGSSGMGKSVLSLQVVEQDRNDWERVNFRGLKGESIQEMLNGLCDYYSQKSSNVLLDDINFGDDHQIYTDSLERLVNLLISSKKKVIVTSQKQLPQQLVSKLNLAPESDFTVPKFSAKEIMDLLLLNSCPSVDIKLWIKDIELTTKSHPQLVHARIRKLKQEGWDKSKIILRTEEESKVKHEVVGQLISELPSEEARNLLLRLSILIGSFKRKNALVLAKYLPEIPTPGVIFNQLIGPYVEQETEDSYRISPLLDNAFQDNFPPEEVKALHQLAGESYLSKTLSPNDLFNIFIHGIMSGSGRIMYFAFAAFQSIGSKHKKLIYPHLELLMYIYLDKPVFENDEVLNLMFRHIQFTLAVETDNSKAALNIADVWFKEVKTFKNRGPFQKEAQSKLFPFMFFLSVFRYTDFEIPIEKCVEWIIGAYAFIKSNPEINAAFKDNPMIEVSSWRELIPEMVLTKRVNSSNIEEFMQSIPNTPEGAEFLSVINDHDTLPKRIVDNVWLDQIDSKTPNWQEALITLEAMRIFFVERKAFNIAATTIRSIALIQNEYLQDEKSARKTISEGKKQIGKHAELINYEAKMAFIKREYATALKIWKSVLPALAAQGDLTAAFAYRDAAVAAANLDKWGLAAEYFKSASIYTKTQREKIYEIQCLADYGFALWKLKKYEECIKVFAEVIDGFAKLPDPKTNLRVLGLLKMTSNTLIYIKKTLNPHYRNIGIPYTEPFPGSHSQTEFSEKLKELPLPPFITLWVFLAEVESGLNIGDTAFSKMKTIYRKLPVLFQVEAKKVEIERELKARNLYNLVDIVVEFFTLTKVSFEAENRESLIKELTPEDIEYSLRRYSSTIINILAFATLRLITKQKYEDIPHAQWIQSAKKYGLDGYKEWIEFIKCFSTMNIKEAREILKNGNAEVSLRLLAAVYILTHDEDRDSSLYAGAILTSTLKDFSIFQWDLDNDLVELLVKRWTEIASALNDLYHDKESTQILEVCKDVKIEGLKKAAKIVLAASNISYLKIDHVKEKLEGIISSQ